MNTSLFRVVLVSISLCWMLFAKTHIDDQVNPDVEQKQLLEAQMETTVVSEESDVSEKSEPAKKTPKVNEALIPIVGNLSAEELAAKEALARELEANKVEKEIAVPLVDTNAKDDASSLEYNLKPVEKTGTIVSNPQTGEKTYIDNNPNAEKDAYYNQLHEEHAATFNGPNLPSVVNDPVYTGENGRTYRQPEASRDGTVDAVTT